jgi:hypothetical protein
VALATQAWYSWVNINGTHTIFLALHSNQIPSPVFSFVGQAYTTSAGSRVFVGNALLAMEVYNDTDHNGYLDANYTTGSTELRYTLLMNASQTFTPYAVNKTTINGVTHYRWGVTYGTIQAFLVIPAPPSYGYGVGGVASVVNVDHVSMFYDYSVVGNKTFLKTSYQIGNVTLIPPTSPGLTLKGLSISLLHSTATVASKHLTVVEGSSPYDSQTNPAAFPFNAAQVTVDNVLAYEFRFNDNYTLLANPPTSHPAVYLASPIDSIPPTAFQGFDPLVRVQQFVQGQLPDLAGLPSTSNIDYTATKFLYRINYPTWSGQAIQHDPTYVSYFSPSPLTNKSSPVWIVYIAVATGTLALLVGFNGMRYTRRKVRPTDEPQDIQG